MTSMSKQDRFVEALTALGGSATSADLMVRLDWVDSDFMRIRKELLQSGTISVTRGRFATISLSTQADASEAPIPDAPQPTVDTPMAEEESVQEADTPAPTEQPEEPPPPQVVETVTPPKVAATPSIANTNEAAPSRVAQIGSPYYNAGQRAFREGWPVNAIPKEWQNTQRETDWRGGWLHEQQQQGDLVSA
jgi:hypothetical protein